MTVAAPPTTTTIPQATGCASTVSMAIPTTRSAVMPTTPAIATWPPEWVRSLTLAMITEERSKPGGISLSAAGNVRRPGPH
jgi:hypothetical protein